MKLLSKDDPFNQLALEDLKKWSIMILQQNNNNHKIFILKEHNFTIIIFKRNFKDFKPKNIVFMIKNKFINLLKKN